MKKGNLITLNRFEGEEAFIKMHDAFVRLLDPEDHGFSVDSMCIGGYLVKDGILIRTSSESPFDSLSVFYDPASVTPEQEALIIEWVIEVDRRMSQGNGSF